MKRLLLLCTFLMANLITAQVVVSPVSDFVTCDDITNDGLELIDLNMFDQEALGGLDPNTHIVSYHVSQVEAVNNTNALPSPSLLPSTPIFVRIEDTTTGSYGIGSVDIIIEPAPFIPVNTYSLCGIPTGATGQVTVDLTILDTTLANGQQGLTYTYHLGQSDAVNDINALLPNFNIPANSLIDLFVRAVSPAGCVAVENIIMQGINCQQNQLSDLVACTDTNDTACFTLDDNTMDALGNNSPNTHQVTYHLTQADADNDTNPLPPIYCTQNDTQIFVRVEETATGNADTAQSFMTIVNVSPPSTTAFSPLVGCDDDGDGFIVYDAISATTEALNDVPLNSGIQAVGLTYFETLADAQNNTNQIGFHFDLTASVNLTTAFVRVEYDPSFCTQIYPIQLIIGTSCFSVGNPSHLLECGDSGTTVCFDLTQHATQIMASNNPADFTISYHTSNADANANTNAITTPSNHCISANEIIYFRLEENATGAYRVGTFDLFINTYIYENNVFLGLTECDTDLDGTVDFDLTDITSQLNPGITLTYYEDITSAQDEILPITNPTAYNFPVNSPFITLFVRETVLGDCDKIYPIELNAQGNCNNSYLCDDAISLCDRIGQPFVNIYDGTFAETGNGNYYPFSVRNPSWFYIPIETSGDLTLEIYQNTQPDFMGQDLDIDYVLYGPFTTATGGCANGITQANYVDHSFSLNMPEIGQINNAQAGEYYLLVTSNFSNQPGFLKVEIGTGSTATVNCDGLKMQSILDVNLNGVVDATDVPFPLGIFNWEKNMSGNVMQVVTPLAEFSIYDTDPTNSYDLGYDVLPAYAANYTVSPATYTGQIIPAGSGITTKEFLVTPVTAYEDVLVYILPQQQPRPGFTYTETVVYANLGSAPVATGQVQFTYDPLLSVVNVTDPAAVINPTTVDLNYTNLMPFEYRTFDVEMQIPVIPTVNLGDLLTNTASITPVTNDITPANNVSTSTQTIIGSYDPNDKMESRGPFINPSEFGASDYLYYTIRFENTGTASAINVRVEDTLDAQLDWTTVEMIDASHTYVLEQLENQLVWRFDNIMLPDSTTDPVGANGYIYFKVKPTVYSEGTVIPNQAEIYFDFNPPIITNNFTTTFQTPLSVDSNEVVEFNLSPNPTSGMVQVSLQNGVLEDAQILLYDMRGRVTLQRKLTNNQQVDITNLPAGIYIAELRNGDAVYTAKVIKE